MQLSRYLKKSSLLLLAISIAGCASLDDTVVVKTEYIEQSIQLQERPKPVNLYPVKFFAVTEKNIDEFLTKFEKENGNVVFFAMSVTDYENMSLNVAELKRYIEQQKALIVYYETNIKMNESIKPTNSEEVVQKGTFAKIKESFGIE